MAGISVVFALLILVVVGGVFGVVFFLSSGNKGKENKHPDSLVSIKSEKRK